MSDPSQSPAGVDHPMRPDLPLQRTGAPYDAGLSTTYQPVPDYLLQPPASAPDEPYARWWQRVVAVIIDSALQIPFVIAELIGLLIALDGGGLDWNDPAGSGVSTDYLTVTTGQMTTTTWIGLVVLWLSSLSGTAFSFWNNIVRQGNTGASIGKSCMNLMVVSEADGKPIGKLMTLIRNWVHLVDLLTAGIGYLWPLWDRKRQTFADMIMRTAVLHLPPLPLRQSAPQIPAQAAPPYGW